jgi:hypothetical protein
MPHHAESAYEIKKWDENIYDAGEEGKGLTQCSIRQVYHGDIEGESLNTMLMAPAEGGSSTYVGLERITGTLGGKTGSFIIQYQGAYAGGNPGFSGVIVAESGTGELHGLKGTASMAAKDGKPTVTLEYDFE